jgi:hypothetical protein
LPRRAFNRASWRAFLKGAAWPWLPVHVGGDPNNAASWKYDMVFGADGKLAYYLKGVESK